MSSEEFGNDVEMLDRWIGFGPKNTKLVMADGASLCVKCALAERDLLAKTMQEGENEQWHPIGYQTMDPCLEPDDVDECAQCGDNLNLW